jgi:hypothetical protein
MHHSNTIDYVRLLVISIQYQDITQVTYTVLDHQGNTKTINDQQLPGASYRW